MPTREHIHRNLVANIRLLIEINERIKLIYKCILNVDYRELNFQPALNYVHQITNFKSNKILVINIFDAAIVMLQ